MSEPVLRLKGVRRTFRQGENTLDVLRGADLTLNAGEIIALVGPSGSGKSTLLHIAGLLERADEGSILIAGKAAERLSDQARTELRRSTVGFVYQFHHLLPEFNAVENVAMPRIIAGQGRRHAKERGRSLLEQVGLGARLGHRPAQLSGGEQQRVAIARALANQPRLLLADEPTGNLDQRTAEEVFALLLDLVRSTGLGAVIATHNPELARRMDRIITLDAGQLREMPKPA